MADLTTDQNYPNVTLSIMDSHDPPRPAAIDGAPVWASSDETVLVVTPTSDDGMSAIIDTVAPGTARITVSADADLGAGVETITAVSEDVNVTLSPLSKASQMTLDLGVPADKP